MEMSGRIGRNDVEREFVEDIECGGLIYVV